MTQFDRVARCYDAMESLLAGRKLERCRNSFEGELPAIHKALLAGEGHGKFLASLLRKNPGAEITCVDASARMLEVCRKRLLRESLPLERVEFIHADILEWPVPEEKYDLLATQFVLDCFTESQLQRVIPRLAAAGRSQALWLIADFQIPASGLPRLRARAIHWLMYRFFRVVTNLPAGALVPPAPLLEQQGFVRIAHRESEWGLLYGDLWRRSSCASPPSSEASANSR